MMSALINPKRIVPHIRESMSDISGREPLCSQVQQFPHLLVPQRNDHRFQLSTAQGPEIYFEDSTEPKLLEQ